MDGSSAKDDPLLLVGTDSGWEGQGDGNPDHVSVCLTTLDSFISACKVFSKYLLTSTFRAYSIVAIRRKILHTDRNMKHLYVVKACKTIRYMDGMLVAVPTTGKCHLRGKTLPVVRTILRRR
jgi:hypothetical protein